MRMQGCGHQGRARRPMGMMMGGWGRRGGGDWGGDWDGEGFGPGRGGARRHGRGPGGRGRVFAGGELRLLLLALIAEQPRHGYELIKAIEELAGGAYAPSPGVVYPTLSLLTDEGVAEEQAGEGTRKAYGVTEAGRKELDERIEEFEGLVERLKAMGNEDSRHAAPPVKRAVANLFAALRSRAASGDFDRETVHQVADILDEAARRIERL